MARELNVICPSGFGGRVRALKGREIDLFANVEEARKRPIMSEVLSACWLGTDNVGPYSHANGQVAWRNVLTGDRLAVLIAIRIATHGDELEFPCKCTNPACRQPKFAWALKLSEVPRKPYTPEALTKFTEGNEIDVTVAGHKYTFCLMTGAVEGGVVDPKRRFTNSIRARLVRIEGIEHNDIRSHIEEMDYPDQVELIAAMDEWEGGYETDVEIECPTCGTEQTIQLPFDRAEFWAAPKKKKVAATQPSPSNTR